MASICANFSGNGLARHFADSAASIVVGLLLKFALECGSGVGISEVISLLSVETLHSLLMDFGIQIVCRATSDGPL
jgi:hypothetical protein